MAYFRVNLKFNMASLGRGMNVFHFEIPGTVPSNTVIKNAVNGWLAAILTPVATMTADSVTMIGANILEVSNLGVTIRNVGETVPAWSPAKTDDVLPLTSAGSVFMHTDVPKVHGSKRVPGFSDVTTTGGLFTNSPLTALAGYLLPILLGPAGFGLPGAVAGVISSAALSFVPFSGSGVATNIVGTQTTRKPLRGS